MATISDRIEDLGIFRSFFTPGETCMAINNRSQIVVASGNVVKTSLVTSKNNYKVLQCPNKNFDVANMSFNESGNLLAMIGTRAVTVCDTRSFPHGDSNVWDTFTFQIGPFDSNVKTFLWHPASRLESEFVVLTETEILLYDAVISFSSPMLTLKLLDYQQLAGKTVSSISFGSKDNFAGSITLYLTTTQGDVYSIYPFVYKGSRIAAKKSLILLFIQESAEALEEVQSVFPPVALLDSPLVLALNQHRTFAQEMEAQVNRPSQGALQDDDIISLSHNGESFGYVLQGPIAKIGSAPTMIQVGSNEDMAVLAAVHSQSSNASFTYLAQLQPLIMGWKNPQQVLSPPVEPARAPLKKKEARYSKPAKGFGYVVDSDSESEDEDVEYIKNLALYKEQLEIFNLKRDLVKYFSDNFNKLSVLAVNGTSLVYGTGKFYFRNVDADKLIFAKDGRVVFINLLQPIKLILSEDSDFKPDYKMTRISPHVSLAYYKDAFEGLGEYIITFAPNSPVQVVPLEVKAKNVAGIVHESFPQNNFEQAYSPGFLTEEMTRILTSIPTKPLPRITNFTPVDTNSMSRAFEVADIIAGRTSDILKFMSALQLKIRTQLEVFHIQIEELHKINMESQGDFEKNNAKIEQLSGRQEELLQKAQKIKYSVSERFETMKLSFALPLSAAEKDWFKEINHLNKIINVGNNDDKSLVDQIKGLKLEVLGLSSTLQKKSTQHNGVDTTIEKLSLSNELMRLKHYLMSEAKLVENVKELADLCNLKLEKADRLHL